MSLDEDKFMVAMKRLAEDPQPMQINCSKMDAWCVMSMVQLACRCPQNVGPARKAAEAWARKLGEVLCGNSPDLRMMEQMGWQTEFDVPFQDNPQN